MLYFKFTCHFKRSVHSSVTSAACFYFLFKFVFSALYISVFEKYVYEFFLQDFYRLAGKLLAYNKSKQYLKQNVELNRVHIDASICIVCFDVGPLSCRLFP